MRLTQIKLSGFKSFVDPTSIHVPGQLVGIVGPNGCGKSNVIDAVRWVLGESRAAALRGDSLQDVIFNGSGNRAALARASVELMFDNSLGRAGGQWSQYAEIAVKRILQREGDSNYYINNLHVRRRDITDIFLGTGLGPRAYAIIEQGMISRVIEARPEELRVFLEEAAGVSKYKERRRETENRLADARENLARVTDIRLELGNQLEKLETQAKVATRYREIQTELGFKQQLLWFLRRRDAAADRERHGREIAGMVNELEAETARLRAAEARVEVSRAAHYKAGDALNAEQASLYGANAEVARHESELRHTEENRQRLDMQHTERRAQLASWRDQRSQQTQSLHAWVSRSGSAKKRATDAQAALAREKACLPQAESDHRAAQQRLSEARERVVQAESRLQIEQANLTHGARDLRSLEERRERLQSELAALRETPAPAEAVSEEPQPNAPLRGWLERHRLQALPRLWQRLRIDQGWETAVESVLRERLHALQLDDAKRLAEILADPPPVKASAFSKGKDSATPPPRGLTPLIAKVRVADPDFAGAVAEWCAGAYVVEGIPGPSERAALPEGAVLVSRDGHQFTRHTVSFHGPDAGDAGLLARHARIEAQLVQARERQRERLAQAEDEARGIARESEESRRRVAAGTAAAAAMDGEIRAARAGLEQATAAGAAAEAALARQREAVQGAERDAQDAMFGERECASKIAEFEHSVRIIDQQIERAGAEITRLAEELAVDPMPGLREALAAAVEQRIACEQRLAEARNAVEAAAQVLRTLEEERLQAENRMAPLRDRVGEMRLKEQAARINEEQFSTQLREANADEAQLLAATEDAPRPSTLQGEITRLTQAMNDMGAVNLAAVEELQSSQERKGFLDTQAADLDEAVRTLEGAIRQIDRETRELLRETFDTVNRHFGALFPVLFGGGEAKLVMTGEEILDAGVQVMAQPPGKRNSTIHLLSGGEKALTAIALVFSMFQLNPAPFCLLDEVDAPLDDSNTERFCALVKKMSAQTQFLFISHNKITMEMAAQLIGVTMPESGVSRVVAVDIEEALRIREELAA